MNDDDQLITLAGDDAGDETPPVTLSHRRLGGESAKAHQAFRAWLDLGPTRGLPGVARALSKSVSLIKRWSARWHWQARLRSWETEQGEVQRAADRASAAVLAAERLAQRARRRTVVSQLMDRAEGLLDDPLAFNTAPAGAAAAVARALRESREEFGRDWTEPETEDGTLLAAGTGEPRCIISVYGDQPIRRFQLPPPGQVEPDTGTI